MRLVYRTGDPEDDVLLVASLPEGDPGIDVTVDAMVGIIRDASRSSAVRAMWAALRTPAAVFDWLRRSQEFVSDPLEVELLQHPDRLLLEARRRGKFSGDCDDVAMLGSAMLAAGGYSPVIVTVGRVRSRAGGRFEHVFYGHKIDPLKIAAASNVVPFDPQEQMFPGVWRQDDLRRLSRLKIFEVLPNGSKGSLAHAPLLLGGG